MQLIYDKPSTHGLQTETVINPSWQQVEKVIKKLDAKDHTEVVLQDGGQISVCGGGGRYFVSIFTEDERSMVLTDPNKQGKAKEFLMCGGQKIALPAERVVDLESAVKAVRCYFDTRTADEELFWVED